MFSRLVRLYAGLVLFGVSIAMLLSADLGLDPWNVFHQGLADATGLPIGWIVCAAAAAVLALWIPLRQRPGLGTISNVVVVGLAVEVALAVIPEPRQLGLRVLLLTSGIVVNAIATAIYIGAGFGPGPRDGLMTGLAQRGISIRRARTTIELSVLAIGWLLGGVVGVGTVLYAVAIGPLTQTFIPWFNVQIDHSSHANSNGAKDASSADHRRKHTSRTRRALHRRLVRVGG